MKMLRGRLAHIIAPSEERLIPKVEQLVVLQARAYGIKDFVSSDRFRDMLNAMNIDVRNGPDWVEWEPRLGGVKDA